jgi:hypothetical protein
MTTQNKDFRVKNGLVVEGSSATVNGNQVLTTASDLSGLIEAGVGVGTSYPTDKSDGALFFNISNLRLAVLYDSVWRELAYITEIESIDGGDSSVTAFTVVYDGGDSETEIFVGAIGGGTS